MGREQGQTEIKVVKNQDNKICDILNNILNIADKTYKISAKASATSLRSLFFIASLNSSNSSLNFQFHF